MSVHPLVVEAARLLWQWQWNQLMNGLAPANKKGEYQRPKSESPNAIIPDEQELKSREKENLPRLIIGRSCPWAHRTWLVYKFKGLETTLNLTSAKADHKAGQWKLETPWLSCNSLMSLYRKCGKPPQLRATVPVLIDPGPTIQSRPKILGNESAQLVEALDKWPTNSKAFNLLPKGLEEEIKDWQDLIQDSVNNGVYRCGFARNQWAYENAIDDLFRALDKINQHLGEKGPWLCGEMLTLADIRLFPTLIRWEMVYMPLFGCSKEPLWSFKNIWEWRQKFFEQPNVAETCDSEAWRNDYFGALFPLNPSNIVYAGSKLKKIVSAIPPHLL